MPELTYAQEPAINPRPGTFALYPLAQLAAAFGLGILGGSYFAVPLSLLISSAALLTVFAGIAILTSDVEKNTSSRRCSATILVVLAVLVVGATLESIEKNVVPPINYYEACLIKEPSRLVSLLN